MILSRQRQGCPRRAGARDREKLELLLRVWRETKPDTYTVACLKTVLSAEVVIIIFFTFYTLCVQCFDSTCTYPPLFTAQI